MIINTAYRIENIKEYYFSKKLRAIALANKNGANIINLGIGNPDMLPPKAVVEALKNGLNQKTAHQYQAYKGIPALRSAMVKWYKSTYNIALDEDQNILPLMGSKEGIMHISMSFLEEGDEVLIPDPGYPAYASAAKLAGAKVMPYPLIKENNYLPDLAFLKKFSLRRVKIMWLNYSNMPTGAKVDYATLENLVQFAKEEKILLVFDNPYGFILNDNPLSIFNVPGAEEVAIELNSLSKMYNMAGWRIGFLAGNPQYLNEVLKFKSNMDSGMFLPIQLAAIAALGSEEEWRVTLNNRYKERRKMAWKLLDSLGCSYERDTAGLFVWAKIPADENNGEEYSDKILEESKVFITPGFVFGKNGNQYIRLSLCHEPSVFDEANNRILSTMNKN